MKKNIEILFSAVSIKIKMCFKNFFIIFILLFFTSKVYSEDLLSKELDIKEKTFVTLKEVQDMGEATCSNALELSEKSNQLANYYSQMLEPFYDADRDEREKTIDKLRKWDAVRFEAQSNKLISLRNNSLVKRAECLFEEGEYDMSISAVYKALDLINVEEEDLWKRSIDLMLSLIELN